MVDAGDARRLATLASYDILDTPAEEGFDDVVQLARYLCDAPVALVSLVAADRQWFKARSGFPLCETDLDSSVCAHALKEPDLLVIEDLTRDPRTRTNPLVLGDPFIRFYAGAPLRTDGGDVLGTLCVIDTVPRLAALTEAQADGLKRLARQVVHLLELRKAVGQREAALSRQELLVRQHRALLEVQQTVSDASGDLDAVYAALVVGAMKALPQAEGEVVELIDGDDLVYHSPQGSIHDRTGLRIPLHGSLAGRSARLGRPLRVADVLTEEGAPRDLLARLGVRSCVLVPVTRSGKVVGVLKLLSARPEAFSDEDLHVARLFAGEAVTGLAETGEAEARRAARASEDRYRSVFDSITDFALIVTDRDGRVTEWNTGAERVLGWSRTEMRGQDVERIFTPEDRAGARARTEMRLSLEDGRASDERWHLRRGGAHFWASGEMMPLRGRTGSHRGYVKVLRDRTAEHLAGQALQAAEARLLESDDHLRHTVELNPAVPWTCDPQGNVTSYSRRWLELTGQAPGEPDGVGWIKVLHPDDVAHTSSVFSACLASGDPVDVDYRVRVAATGEYRWMRARAYPRRGDDGGVVRWYGVVEDVHDRRVVAARLRESEAMFRTLAQAVPNHIWSAAADGSLEWANEPTHAYSGMSEDGTVGSAWTGRVHPDDLPAAMGRWASSLATGATYETEFRVRRADGVYRWFLVRALPVHDAEGAVVRWIGANTDVEDQRALSEALARANATLEQRVEERTTALQHSEEALRQSQKMEAVGQLTGGLAHDFNNLLTAITGGLDLLQMRLAQGRMQDASRYIAMAQGAAKRAAALTHRLLAFSRRQTLAPKSTDVNRLLADLEDLIRRTVGPAIRLETVMAAGLWNTLVDPSQLENAVLNLCINARDAMPDGGTIVVETGNAVFDQPTAANRDLPPGRYVTVSVSDDGTGMPADVVARAFDPFFTTKPIGQGTGLGLSMIYGFSRQSGGHVRIYSEVGMGTRVCLYLPRHAGEEDRPVSASSADLPRARHGETVLVVDDETAVRVLVTDVLGDLGYGSLEAADGADGLAILRSDVRIDLLVTDVGLPGGMNGRQVADAARQLRPGLKVLFITGYAENAVLSHGHLDPGMHVLAKPFAIDALAERIRQLIEH